MSCSCNLIVTLFVSINFVTFVATKDSVTASENISSGSNVTSQSTESQDKALPTGILGRLLNMVQAEKERIFVPIRETCTLPSLSESMVRHMEYQYFCYRIKTDGMTRFGALRQSLSSIASYSEFKRILFPTAAETRHPFFGCAFDMFFNHLMNRTPYIWLQWIDFDGSRFPLVWWQKVNVTKSGVFPARTPDSDKPVIRMDAMPLSGSQASWSWEEGGQKADPNPSSESSGITASSDSVTTGKESVTSDASSTFREGPMALMGSLSPLIRTARSIYSIYEHWRGLPQLQVRITLA